jgi:hypothetical protein
MVLALTPATALAERHWQAPAPIVQDPAASPQVAIAADGTLVITWVDAHGLHARVGERETLLTSERTSSMVVAAGNEVAVAWSVGEVGYVAAGSTTSGLGAPASLDDNFVGRLLGNDAGEISLLAVRYTEGGYEFRSSFRPAGGEFGTPVLSPSRPNFSTRTFATNPVPVAALSPAGETLLAWGGSDGAHVVSRVRDGVFGDVIDLPGSGHLSIRGGPEVAFDGQNRAIVAWGADGGLRAAIRNADGEWRPASGLDSPVAFPGGYPTLGTSRAGDAVLGWYDGAEFRLATGALGDGAFTPARAYPVDLQPEGIGPVYEYPTVGPPTLRVAADGSAVAVWGDYESVLVARREGTGAFGPATVAACQHSSSYPQILGAAADGVWSLQITAPSSLPAIVRDAPGPGAPPVCPPGEPDTSTLRVHYAHTPIAGEPVRITVTGLPTTITRTEWHMTDATKINRSASLRYAFPDPGRIGWSLLSASTTERPYRFHTDTDVYVRATLKARRRHGRVAVTVTAFTYGPKRTVAVAGHRIRVGLEPRTFTLHTRRPWLTLRQGGKVRVRAKVT